MGLGSSSPEDMDQLEETKQVVKKLIDSDEIVVFSKTTCPYCKSAKGVSFVFEYALRGAVNYL
jgi:thioredoxin-related protein